MRSFRVSFVRLVYRAFVRSLRVSCIRFVYRAFVSCIVRFSFRSCEAFVRFSFVSFAFGAYWKLIRSRICSALKNEISKIPLQIFLFWML